VGGLEGGECGGEMNTRKVFVFARSFPALPMPQKGQTTLLYLMHMVSQPSSPLPAFLKEGPIEPAMLFSRAKLFSQKKNFAGPTLV
jgi:hypothetical protein